MTKEIQTRYQSDIVSALSKRLMNDVVEEIFNYLDYESLKNSEAVSSLWYNNILYGKTWKKLLERNLKLSEEWKEMLEVLTMKWSLDSNVPKDYMHCRALCQQVGNSVSKLRQNWLKGQHSKYEFPNFSQPEIESIFWIRGSLNFEMNKHWIGRGQRDGSIIIWNRWTWETKALFEPLLLTNRLLGCNTVRCLQFNDHVVVASYFGGSICIWDTHTTELLHVLDEMDLANYDSHYIPVNGLSLGGSPGSYWLLSCLSSPTEQDFVTLRLITNPSDEIPIVHRIVLDQKLRVLRLLVNERNVLLLLSDTETKNDQIQIRATSSMEILKTIQIPYSEMGVFDCRNGLILSGSRYEIQLWDLETGTCLRSVSSSNSIVFVKIISDKYWVSCNSSGKVEVWNLRAALDPTHMDSLLLYRLTATDLNFPLICPVVRADEYQIALIPCRAKDYSGLHILDFLQLDHKDVDDTGFISDQ
ncbi:F-box/WD repeat-containing protein 1A-like [Daphnia pulicaria]|uniref:F-box/WD repeat-containing protein 1A-like n=1 Tax=Daphnia pulicaria TaxID=35523 RepID=UPI001EEC2C58|nr:F-box/WD repeat-containing protein 1A-like [Daphnia pulicaria]